ncbi:TetR/AcrR family transcriptional regulator [Nocardiopsis sp. RSe5-2]|uniref:TetR/AcrR family transcriptional regulator n=1 Tax=Nocardiopsis endophytica TaxID=3018445 RepID=A0ABT4UBF3_9ACTN|nr:TetR/AcrR family transcriptional regulator [Nocardiopsis endophytica]MDA2814260.1 TetR/AcrR family transcriptional regulator [Nocardiopsis endophytica]
MSPIQGTRTGGRSARVQQAVHDAVRDLQRERSRSELSVPLVAQRAGVTPSTVYRRWGTLQELLADVARERMRPDDPPDDTGALDTDLKAWARQYLEEISSSPGREYVRDLVASEGEENSEQCNRYCQVKIRAILDRAAERGEPHPDADTVTDRVTAPIVFRVFFAPGDPTPEWAEELIDQVLADL